MKLTRRTFLKFLGLVVVPVAPVTVLANMKAHKTEPESLEEAIIKLRDARLEARQKRRLSSSMIKSMYEQRYENINYGGSTLDEESNRIANKALARSLRQTQEIHLSNIINRKA